MEGLTLLSAPKFVGFISLGFITGFYGTLIGAGGGFVLMPILLLLYPEAPPEQLTSISLAVVLFNALGGSESYALMRRIDYKSGLMFAGATIPGAIVGALNTGLVHRQFFDFIFSVALVSSSIFLFVRSSHTTSDGSTHHSRHEISRHLIEANGVAFDYSFNPWLGIVLSFFVGYASSFLGIGGGIIHVPAMTYLLNFPVHIATATSHFVLAIMAFTGTVTHVITGAFTHGVNLTLSLAIGALLGAPLGAYLSNRIGGAWIIRGLAIALGLVGVRILMNAL
jgi:uncharacterized protein